eukprot:scaffold40182_cov67-Phaeocystis_antarctica.AAC.1
MAATAATAAAELHPLLLKQVAAAGASREQLALTPQVVALLEQVSRTYARLERSLNDEVSMTSKLLPMLRTDVAAGRADRHPEPRGAGRAARLARAARRPRARAADALEGAAGQRGDGRARAAEMQGGRAARAQCGRQLPLQPGRECAGRDGGRAATRVRAGRDGAARCAHAKPSEQRLERAAGARLRGRRDGAPRAPPHLAPRAAPRPA